MEYPGPLHGSKEGLTLELKEAPVKLPGFLEL